MSGEANDVRGGQRRRRTFLPRIHFYEINDQSWYVLSSSNPESLSMTLVWRILGL